MARANGLSINQRESRTHVLHSRLGKDDDVDEVTRLYVIDANGYGVRSNAISGGLGSLAKTPCCSSSGSLTRICVIHEEVGIWSQRLALQEAV
jgi:hypothetical protein